MRKDILIHSKKIVSLDRDREVNLPLYCCTYHSITRVITLLTIFFLGACDDNDLSRRGSAVFVTDSQEYTFPAPSFESQSSELGVMIQNQGGGGLIIVGVMLEERDDVKEISILDEDDWTSGQVIIAAGREKEINFAWSVLDAQADEATVTFLTNVGDYTFELNTPDIDPELYVYSEPMLEGNTRGGRVELGNVPAGGVGRVRVTLQSIGAINLNVNELCFLGDDNQCLEREETPDQSGSFILCDGLPELPDECQPVEVGLLLPGATKTLSVFYRPDENELDAEVARLSIQSNSGTNPSYLLSLQASPCVRSEAQPECGGCGDGEVNGAETCDDGNLDMSDGCLNSCVLASCGDGVLHVGVEACDDENDDNTDACTDRCEIASCGDGYLQEGEVCDEGGESATCNSDCTLAMCGDGVANTSSGEECDESGDGLTCNADCSLSRCGDGNLNPIAGEVCDDDNSDTDDGCSETCEVEDGYVCDGEPSTCDTVCGDNVQAGLEACDDGNTETEGCEYGLTSCTVCAADCTNAAGLIRYCGDGVVEAGEGEACDDGNTDADDGCSETCEVEDGYVCDDEPSTCDTVCGDSVQAGLEACDDGNTETEGCEYGLTSCTVCAADCINAAGLIRYCGDGVVEAGEGEACDDGNTDADDGCSETCEVEDGYVCDDEPSTCDTVCGDSVQAGLEACDDGNTETEGCEYGLTSCTVCAADCINAAGLIRYCGDGVVEAGEGEACDDGNADADDGCSETCEVEDGYVCDGEPSTCDTVCGDNVQAGLEACDDGNTETEGCEYGLTSCTVCAADCTNVAGLIRYCGDGVVEAGEGEACDDGNADADDGCSETCIVEDGYVCGGEPSTCDTVCGDNVQAGLEACDDGNTETEGCEYGLTSCTVCAADCTNAAGLTRYCGDGVVEADEGEACDDGNTNADDGCSSVCAVEDGYVCGGEPSTCTTVCGDNVQAGLEACDDGNTETEGCEYGLTSCTVCAADCTNAAGLTRYCGDGVIEADEGEACDDGNTNADDGCSSVCAVEDGYVCGGEPSTCTTVCGDNVQAGLEACDDGNTETEGCEYGLTSCTVCAADCTNAAGLTRYCGDGVVEADEGEACDDGNTDADDGCSSVCAVEDGYVCDGEPSTCDTVCGDNVQAGLEACDDGNTETEGCEYGLTSCTVCAADCTNAAGLTRYCGDGVVEADEGEACDDGNTDADDGCSAVCAVEDGYVCGGEPSTCTTVCGDNIQAGLEACDDGNTETEGCEYGLTSCTVCAADCTNAAGLTRYCGDGVVEADEGEACDDGNTDAGDGCSAVCAVEDGYVCGGEPSTCSTVCGDNIQAGLEACDDGNAETEDCAYGLQSCNNICRADCTLGEGIPTYCGDQILNGPEECDLGGDNGVESCEYGEANCQVCSATCSLEAGSSIFCGDGIVQEEFEDCDGTRGCSNACTLPCSPNCPPIEMIDISPGSFTMGSGEFFETLPAHGVTISYPFQISRTEVTVEAYSLCVDSEYCTSAGVGGACNTGTGRDNHPQNCITRAQMRVFATWVGADIPTEAEWEYAGRLQSNRTFPWGESTSTACSLSRANICGIETREVCSMDNGITPEGLCDMSGNVQEWTIDIYESDHSNAPSDGSAQCGGGDCDLGTSWVTKSGGYTGSVDQVRLYYRERENTASPKIGGRIVRF